MTIFEYAEIEKPFKIFVWILFCVYWSDLLVCWLKFFNKLHSEDLVIVCLSVSLMNLKAKRNTDKLYQ